VFSTRVVGPSMSHRMPQKSKSMRKRGRLLPSPAASSGYLLSPSSFELLQLAGLHLLPPSPSHTPHPFLFISPAGSDPFMSFISTFSLRFRLCGLRISSFSSTLHPRRQFNSSRLTMSNSIIQLTAPNGRKYAQPIGLFINNEFVPSKSGEQFATINPRYRSS
jgi:hypothetical protein